MARFTTRIQLENATEKDYSNLQAQLEHDTSGTVKRSSSQGKEKLVLDGEFSFEGNINIREITAAVVNAAAKTGRKYSFTIIRSKPASNN